MARSKKRPKKSAPRLPAGLLKAARAYRLQSEAARAALPKVWRYRTLDELPLLAAARACEASDHEGERLFLRRYLDHPAVRALARKEPLVLWPKDDDDDDDDGQPAPCNAA